MNTRTLLIALRGASISAIVVAGGCSNDDGSGAGTPATTTTAAAAATDTPPNDTTAGAPGSAWMVIQVNAGGRAELRLVDRDGTEIGAPASDVPGGDQTNPEWSPDGDQLTFGMTGEDGRDDLWVVDADGGSASVLYDCADDCEYIDDPAWSGDGASIAVCIVRSVDGADLGSLALVDAGTGELTDLATFDDTQFCAGARWSPDDRRIVLEVVQRAGTTMADDVTGVTLTLVDAASGAIVRTLTDPALFAATADWNPVTGEILYSALPAADAIAPDLFAVRPDGSAPERLTTLSDEGGAAIEPTVTDDGTSVVFVGSGSIAGLARLDLATGTVEPAFPRTVSANHPRHRPGATGE